MVNLHSGWHSGCWYINANSYYQSFQERVFIEKVTLWTDWRIRAEGVTAGTILTVCKMMKAKIKEEGKKRYFSFGVREIESCIST